jgi:hypothetical protein
MLPFRFVSLGEGEKIRGRGRTGQVVGQVNPKLLSGSKSFFGG